MKIKDVQKRSLYERIKRKNRRKWYYTVSVTMAAVVVFCTVYALILPAITLEKKQKVLDCPLSVHQHTVECRDKNGTLICGQADFVIHTHRESCYNADGKLVCQLPEIAAHEHTDDCYETQEVLICTNNAEEHTHNDSCYQTEKTLVCKETAVLHTHGDTCYDENGTLTCDMLQVTEHVHGDACFQPEKQAAASELQTDVMPVADTNQTWGYNDDGSIWWSNGANLTQISVVQENTPYIIAGFQGNNLMGDEPFEKSGYSYLKAIPKEDADYASYQRWYFEKAGGDKRYYIYYLAADNSTKKYLRFAGAGITEWNKPSQQVVLTNEKTLATVFTVERVGDMSPVPSGMADYPNHIAVSATINGTTYYINSYFGDKPKSNGSTTHWWGYSEVSSGSALKLCQYTPNKQTANRVETASSPNTVINLFDYWLSDKQSDRFNPDNRAAAMNAGINKDHALKFVYNKESTENINQWTGSGKNPQQGIVCNTLGPDGYPVLSGKHQTAESAKLDSLAYLFDPAISHDGKASYRNVGGLLSIDDQGYYAYDCMVHAAEFNEENNSFNVYDTPAAGGQFFPFNKTPEIMDATRDDPKINHYFGATITNRFVQQHSGYTDDKHNTPTTFEFSGDDDVWIFIDGVLVGDVGGIHDAAHVSINFATGVVEVGVINGTDQKITTTLQECYVNAGKYNESDWTTENGNTIYKDGTVHTLKFFYLERGNYSSNMKLKYNLTEIPKTAIYKVDQYGEKVQGAVFAVYAADGDQYAMLDGKGGSVVDLSDDSYTYDQDGNIVDSDGNIIVHALYTGTTNNKGEMLFADSDGMPYSISEMEDMFGKHFILREIRAPDGYRVVIKDVHLQIWQGANQKILKCDNTEKSGSRAASNLQITATDTLYLQNSEQTSVKYFDSNTNTAKGTLFAVIYKYIGAIDENGNATDINVDKSWVPVYGSDQGGYTKVDMSNDRSLIDGALEAAKKGQAYGDVVFKLSPNGTMQLTMENLPGHITTYYRMLGDDQKGQTRYTAVYYWTEADTLEGATETNTHRVYTFAEAVPDGTSYSGFERVFGADIHVPNLINKVFVQKVDEKNNPINGATFAIYQVHQLEDGTIQYFSKKDNGYHTLSADAVIASNGEITDGTLRIYPLTTDVTKTYEDGIHTGTAEFTNLSDGQYIIKEVKPPPGYRINTADVMLLVTEDTIYANAGTEDDGITVGRGPGYLVTSLEQFAAEDQIDNTLTWIYARMLITYPSTSFADVGDVSKIKGYIAKNYTNVTTKEESEAFRTNLIYDTDKVDAAFNYVPDPKRNKGTDSDGYRRVFTTEGWNYYSIFQDYEYGKPLAEKNGANYENWSGQNLMHLFSRSTYIRVMDEQETTLKVKKVDATTPSAVLSGATFRLYQTGEDGIKQYYAWDPQSRKVLWTKEETQALVVTTREDGISDNSFTGLKDGTYFLEEIKAPDGYSKMTDPVELKIVQAKLTVGFHSFTVEDALDETTNLYTYTLTVPNRGDFIFPATGGNGTIFYTLGGILLMGIPLVYGCRKKCRSERRGT